MDELILAGMFILGFLGTLCVIVVYGRHRVREAKERAAVLRSILEENQSLRDQLASAVSADAAWLQFRRDIERKHLEQVTARAALEPPMNAPLEVERPIEIPMPPHGGV